MLVGILKVKINKIVVLDCTACISIFRTANDKAISCVLCFELSQKVTHQLLTWPYSSTQKKELTLLEQTVSLERTFKRNEKTQRIMW